MGATAATPKRDLLLRRRRIRRRLQAAVLLATASVLAVTLGYPFLAPGAPAEESVEDLSPPTLAAVEPPGGTFLPEGAATFRLTFSEPLAASPLVALVGSEILPIAERAFDGLAWRGDVDIPAGADDTYAVELRDAHDPAGNALVPAAVSYVVDTTPPTSQAFLLSTSEDFVELAWETSDGTGSGVVAVELWIREDEGPWRVAESAANSTGTYRLAANGIRSVQAYTLAVDGLGHREEPPDIPDANVTLARTAPAATLQPVPAYWSRGPVVLRAVATETTASAELWYGFAADNASWEGPFSGGNRTPPLVWEFAFPQGPGHYRLHSVGRSVAGAQETDSLAVEVVLGFDALPPASWLDPAATYWIGSDFHIAANAADDLSGPRRVELLYAYRGNETAAWSPWTVAAEARDAAPWILRFAFSEGDGTYALATRAYDVAGNEEPLPRVGEGDVILTIHIDPPAPAVPAVPRFLDPANGTVNLTWSATPEPDVVRFEVHRGTRTDFVPDARPCGTSVTCVGTFDRDVRSAWVPVPLDTVSHFRVRVVDAGDLARDSASVAVARWSEAYDTPSSFGNATQLAANTAWSQHLEHGKLCLDCEDTFRLSLAAGDILTVFLAVPKEGDFSLLLYDGDGRLVAVSARIGRGVWESLSLAVGTEGTYYVRVTDLTIGTGEDIGPYTLSLAVG